MNAFLLMDASHAMENLASPCKYGRMRRQEMGYSLDPTKPAKAEDKREKSGVRERIDSRRQRKEAQKQDLEDKRTTKTTQNYVSYDPKGKGKGKGKDKGKGKGEKGGKDKGKGKGKRQGKPDKRRWWQKQPELLASKGEADGTTSPDWLGFNNKNRSNTLPRRHASRPQQTKRKMIGGQPFNSSKRYQRWQSVSSNNSRSNSSSAAARRCSDGRVRRGCAKSRCAGSRQRHLREPAHQLFRLPSD